MNRICFKSKDIILTQQGRDNFTVTYWKQIKRKLTYGQAALELGCCLMHRSACDYKLDNRKKGAQ